jgi:hypothetical protein
MCLERLQVLVDVEDELGERRSVCSWRHSVSAVAMTPPPIGIMEVIPASPASTVSSDGGWAMSRMAFARRACRSSRVSFATTVDSDSGQRKGASESEPPSRRDDPPC